MADHDRQRLIELDGKLAPIELFKVGLGSEIVKFLFKVLF